MDPLRTGSERGPAKRDVIVLTDSENGASGGMGRGDRCEAVVCARREIDDDPIDVREGRLERRLGPDRSRLAARGADEIGKSGGPDQVVGEDGDAGDQTRPSAR
jgi:hypothetical protein